MHVGTGGGQFGRRVEHAGPGLDEPLFGPPGRADGMSQPRPHASSVQPAKAPMLSVSMDFRSVRVIATPVNLDNPSCTDCHLGL